jgi:hypothetical protein
MPFRRTPLATPMLKMARRRPPRHSVRGSQGPTWDGPHPMERSWTTNAATPMETTNAATATRWKPIGMTSTQTRHYERDSGGQGHDQETPRVPDPTLLR